LWAESQVAGCLSWPSPKFFFPIWTPGVPQSEPVTPPYTPHLAQSCAGPSSSLGELKEADFFSKGSATLFLFLFSVLAIFFVVVNPWYDNVVS